MMSEGLAVFFRGSEAFSEVGFSAVGGRSDQTREQRLATLPIYVLSCPSRECYNDGITCYEFHHNLASFR